MNSRCCSRTACKQPPVYTLTYVYKDSTAVLGPLAVYVDPHSWDLCEMHAARLVVPRGWDVVRLPKDPAQERADDLEALANVVRDVARAERASLERSAPARPAPPLRQQEQLRQAEPRQAVQGTVPRPGAPQRPPAEPVGQGVEVGRRGHLRVVRSAPAPQPEA
ncbi:MAG TPA: DUF3499 domain-containing protein [Trebonia sp.]